MSKGFNKMSQATMTKASLLTFGCFVFIFESNHIGLELITF
jgi:hypothetical protein